MSDKTYTGNEGLREQTANQLWVGLIIRNTIRQSSVTVGTSPTKIPTSTLTNRRTLLIHNNSSNVVYLGDAAVTTSDGLPVYPRGTVQITVEDSVDIYGVASNSSNVRILEGA